ncbi:unnamed protein product, partial [Amoebophrya sp. A120]
SFAICGNQQRRTWKLMQWEIAKKKINAIVEHQHDYHAGLQVGTNRGSASYP